MALESVLHILKDGQEVFNQKLEGEILVGRSEGCAIRLDDRAISRKHLKLVVMGDGVQLEKRSDFSPVRVNGQDTERALLKNGDQVGVGPYLMRLEIFEAKTRQTHNDPGGFPISAAVAEAQAGGLALDAAPDSPAASVGEFLPFETEDRPHEAAPAADLSLVVGNEFPQSSPAESQPLMVSSAPSESDDDGQGGGFGNNRDDNGDDGSEDSNSPLPDDGRTRVASLEKIEARLVFSSGSANFETFMLQDQEISIGRGKICTIVLNDKKASRKHAIVRRVGASFIIKDLKSANGTYVNGVKVEEQELSGDDRISIGDIEFTFQAVAADYQEQNIPSAESILPNDDDIPSLDGIGGFPLGSGMDMGQPAAAPYQPQAASPMELNFQQATPAAMASLNQLNNTAGKKQTLYEKYIRNFKDLNPKQKVVTVFMIASLTYFLFLEEEDREIPQARGPATARVARSGTDSKKGQAGMKEFGLLPPDKQRFVDSQYNLAYDHLQNREFDKALYEVQKIFTYVDEYKEAKRLEQLAKDGKRTLERVEEEKRKKEREEQIKVRVAQLLEEATELMKNKNHLQAREIFGEILALDPENAKVAEWQKELLIIEEEKAIAAQKEEIEKATTARGWDLYRIGKDFQKKGKCHSAIAKYNEVLGMGASDRKLNRVSKSSRGSCVASIRSQVKPHLESAKTAEAEQDFVGAFQGYRKVVQIDPPNKEGRQGIARVRGKLHELGKVLYTEGIIAEDYSDLVTARAKFEKILESIPEDDRYYQSAARKLDRFKVLTGRLDEAENRAPAEEEPSAD